jgi:ABC-type transport system involved in cytochrome bd biosynthesis fused ATPase/permease subunit
MSISNILFGFWRKISLPFLSLTLIVIYVTLPDNIAIHHDEKGNPDRYTNKQTLFFTVVAVGLVFNFLTLMLKNQMKKIDFSKLSIASPWMKSEKTQPMIAAWFDAFIAFVNSFIALTLIAVNRINHRDGQTLDINYNWFLIGGAIILMILIFYLPLRLLFTSPAEEGAL